MTTSPRRFKDAPEALPQGLSRALRDAPGDPSNEELQALAATLGKSLGVGISSQLAALPRPLAAAPHALIPAASMPAAASVAHTIGAWVLAGFGVGLAASSVGAVAIQKWSHPAPQTRPAEPRARATGAVRASNANAMDRGEHNDSEPSASASVAALTPELAPTPAVPSATQPTPSEGKPAPTHPHPTLASRSESPASESEVSLLRRAQAALSVDPASSLALASLHQQRYPNGALAQEREVIAIEALLELGRTAQTEERARRFTARFPGSAHERRIDSLLGRTPQ